MFWNLAAIINDYPFYSLSILFDNLGNILFLIVGIHSGHLLFSVYQSINFYFITFYALHIYNEFVFCQLPCHNQTYNKANSILLNQFLDFNILYNIMKMCTWNIKLCACLLECLYCDINILGFIEPERSKLRNMRHSQVFLCFFECSTAPRVFIS